MLALNKSVIKVKESQIKGFKMIFELFRKVATSPKSTPDSMTNSTILTFNTDGKKLTEPYRVCRRVNILRDYPDDKIKIYP